MSSLALAITLFGIFVVLAWLAGAVILGGWRLFWGLPWCRPALERAAPWALLLPLVVAAALPVAAAVPAAHGTHCGEQVAGGFHLCMAHPWRSHSMVPLAMVPLALLGWRIVLRLPALRSRVRLLRALGWRGTLLTKVSAPLGNAFSVSLPKPRVVVDRSLWRRLDPHDRRILLAHEVAHLRRGDPLLLEILALAGLLQPGGLVRCVFGAWRRHAERQADAAAARETGDPVAVASLLVRMNRPGLPPTPRWLAFQDQRCLEERVVALLEEEADSARLRLAIPSLGGTAVLLAAAVLPALCAAEIHHGVEALVRLVAP